MQWVRNARNANTENKRITHAHTAKWTNETEAAGESKKKMRFETKHVASVRCLEWNVNDSYYNSPLNYTVNKLSLS